MNKPQSGDFCLWINADELKMILSALNAYSHNTDYVELMRRLNHQIGASDVLGASCARPTTRSLAS